MNTAIVFALAGSLARLSWQFNALYGRHIDKKLKGGHKNFSPEKQKNFHCYVFGVSCNSVLPIM